MTDLSPVLAPVKYVRLKPNAASPGALSIIKEGVTYGVIGSTKTTYQLTNLATGRRIGADGLQIDRFVPRQLWFEDVPPPSASEIALSASETPVYQPPDPYVLRKSLPTDHLIWKHNDQRDIYTSRSKEWYDKNNVSTERDHKLEVNCHRHRFAATASPPPLHHHNAPNRSKLRAWHASTRFLSNTVKQTQTHGNR
tara:strand:- start:526 stop:1113 length:588 start_codon:yes stop_codon:yes gene_type:complete